MFSTANLDPFVTVGPGQPFKLKSHTGKGYLVQHAQIDVLNEVTFITT